MRKRWIVILALVLLADAILGAFLYLRWRNRNHDSEIQAAARRYDVDPLLIKAVIWKESRFKAKARGAAGEIGLMQIRDLAAQDWASAEKVSPFDHEMIIDPGTNTLVGAWYLAKLIQRYPHTDQPLVYALADYNAGRTHVLRWMKEDATTNSGAFLERMDYPTTRQYIGDVLKRYEKLKK